jgi:superfamily II DNA/RNA helicase
MLVVEDADEITRLGFKDTIFDIFRLLQPPKLLTRKSASGSSSSSESQAQVVAALTNVADIARIAALTIPVADRFRIRVTAAAGAASSR